MNERDRKAVLAFLDGLNERQFDMICDYIESRVSRMFFWLGVVCGMFGLLLIQSIVS